MNSKDNIKNMFIITFILNMFCRPNPSPIRRAPNTTASDSGSDHDGRALFSHPYGFSLFYHKPVEQIMDTAPLITDAGRSIEEAVQKAMDR